VETVFVTGDVRHGKILRKHSDRKADGRKFGPLGWKK